MGIEKQNYNGRGNGYEGLSANDEIWDATLEVISEKERIRYRIYERYAELKAGDSFDVTTVFGEDGVSVEEYMEFLNVMGKLINRYPLFETDVELHEALEKVSVEGSEDATLFYKIGNSYMGRNAYVEATKWHMRAAELGHSEAMSVLGGGYRHGIGVEQDIMKAVQWYKRSIVADGNDNALLDLGLCYLKGEGVPLDHNRGFFLMERSAKQGNMMAQFNMGTLYRLGRGVNPDIEEALRWYCKSANQGYEQAVDFLAQYDGRATENSK